MGPLYLCWHTPQQTRTSQAVEAGRLQCVAGFLGQVARLSRGRLEGRAIHKAPLQARNLTRCTPRCRLSANTLLGFWGKRTPQVCWEASCPAHTSAGRSQKQVSPCYSCNETRLGVCCQRPCQGLLESAPCTAHTQATRVPLAYGPLQNGVL